MSVNPQYPPSASDTVLRRKQRILFTDKTIQETAVAEGLRNRLVLEGGQYNGAMDHMVYIHMRKGAVDTTPAEEQAYIDSVVPRNSPTEQTVPDSPTGVSASPGDTEATISFTPPVNDGGSTITIYTVTSTPEGLTVSGASSPLTLTGLTNGTSYTFTVTATNAIGTSISSSPSNAIIPAILYTIAFTTTGFATWTAPATCQTPITYWIVGGGGGGAGAYDQRGGGGGGGGAATTGTYAVVGGTTYDIVIGAGGAGGTGRGTLTLSGPFGSDTDGTDGIDSSFDLVGGGPVAAGGGKGLDGTTGTLKAGGTGGVVTTGGGGGGGGGSGGGGGGAGGNGTAGTNTVAGIGGIGISFTIPDYNGGNAQVYGAGGNGGANNSSGFAVGADGLANTGKGGQGGRAASFQPPYAGGVIKMGGDGGSGIVVLSYYA
jgi:hypothetical protein